MDVGVRELKEHLAEYIERAARGEVIRVTDRGRPRVLLTPLPGASRLDMGAQEGWVRCGSGAPIREVSPQSAALTIEDALGDDRGDA